MLKLKIKFQDILALCAGIYLIFAFAPFGIYPVAVICPALLLCSWLNSTPTQAFWRGFLFGLGIFGIGASWVYISIHNFGNANMLLAGSFTAVFIIALALFIAIQGYLFTKIFPITTPIKLLLGFPCTWVLFEWLRSWVFTGFPWLFLGASQANSPLHGFAPIVGEYGISFAVTLCSSLLVLAIIAWRAKKHLLFIANILAVAIIWIGAAALAPIQWTTPINAPIRVALIQGNTPQQLKWSRDYLETILQHYSKITALNWNNQLIVWPEAAIPMLAQDAQGFLAAMDRAAKQHQTTLVTGIPIQIGFTYYNAAMALGTGHGIYYKRHLVPFGEYIPLQSWLGKLLGFLNIPMSDFKPGELDQPLLQMPKVNLAIYVCYEIAYADLVLHDLPRANMLITISDDAWFGESFAAAQHLQIGQIRAQETGRYNLFSSNTGVTAIIDPHGKIIASGPQFVSIVVNGTVRAMAGATPFVLLGVNLIIGSILGLFILAIVFEVVRRRSTTPTN